MLTRRTFLSFLPASLTWSAWTNAAHGAPLTLSFEDEIHQGDPTGPTDIVSFKQPFKGVGPTYQQIAQSAMDDPVDRTLLPPPPAQGFALRLLKISNEYAQMNVSRTNEHKEHVRRFLRLFGFDLTLPNSGEKVAFCAAGLCFAACRAFFELTKRQYDVQRPSLEFRHVLPILREHFFLANPMCINIYSYARRYRKNFVDNTVEPKPGWPVLFSWRRNGKPNHIGIVKEAIVGGKVTTVEFNTSPDDSGSQSDGGYVAERHRNRDTILGYIKLY